MNGKIQKNNIVLCTLLALLFVACEKEDFTPQEFWRIDKYKTLEPDADVLNFDSYLADFCNVTTEKVKPLHFMGTTQQISNSGNVRNGSFHTNPAVPTSYINPIDMYVPCTTYDNPSLRGPFRFFAVLGRTALDNDLHTIGYYDQPTCTVHVNPGTYKKVQIEVTINQKNSEGQWHPAIKRHIDCN